jgi:hypothetical protein
MHENELSGCGVDSRVTFGLDPISGKWVKEEVPFNCGDFVSRFPFKYNQRFCTDCALRNRVVVVGMSA